MLGGASISPASDAARDGAGDEAEACVESRMTRLLRMGISSVLWWYEDLTYA